MFYNTSHWAAAKEKRSYFIQNEKHKTQNLCSSSIFLFLMFEYFAPFNPNPLSIVHCEFNGYMFCSIDSIVLNAE